MSTTTTTHRVEYLCPGFFLPEESYATIEKRSVALAVEAAPDSAYCFVLYDVPETPDLGPEFTVRAKPQNKSGRFYLGGELFTLPEVEALGHDILASNMRANGWDRVIRCRTGNWQPFEDGDELIPMPPVARLSGEGEGT